MKCQRRFGKILLGVFTPLIILVSGSFIQSEGRDKTPAGQVVWHHVARALLSPVNGTGEVIGYLSQLAGVPGSLFNGTPSELTAFFTLRTDTLSVQPLASNGDVQLSLLSPGALNVYFNTSPANDWTKPDTFSSGQLVATFSRAESMLIVIGPLQTDTASYELVSSRDFTFAGQTLNFKDLTPHGFTLTNSASNTPLASGVSEFPVAFAFGGHTVAVGSKLSALGPSAK